MAQDPGADSLIAPSAKTTSAGVILALVVAAVLALSGCGGGSDSQQTASAPSADTSAGAQGGADPSSSPGKAASSPSSSSSSPSSGKAAGQEGSPPAGSTTPSVPGQGNKHGKSIVLPEGEPEKAATPAEKAEATAADIALASPELQSAEGATAALVPSNGCEGKNTPPTLLWKGVPQGTAELALFAMNVQPVGGKLFFDWAVAGIDPSLEGIEAGRLPKGAVLGTNSFGQVGYSICPPPGSPETYIFALYALPQQLPAAKGFDARALRDRILAISGDVGLMGAAYSR
jgi:phosphatidylethanolamine-binding protein (PEBP) family uncharacterized protein